MSYYLIVKSANNRLHDIFDFKLAKNPFPRGFYCINRFVKCLRDFYHGKSLSRECKHIDFYGGKFWCFPFIPLGSLWIINFTITIVLAYCHYSLIEVSCSKTNGHNTETHISLFVLK